MYSDPERYNNEDLFKIEYRKKDMQKWISQGVKDVDAKLKGKQRSH